MPDGSYRVSDRSVVQQEGTESKWDGSHRPPTTF